MIGDLGHRQLPFEVGEVNGGVLVARWRWYSGRACDGTGRGDLCPRRCTRAAARASMGSDFLLPNRAISRVSHQAAVLAVERDDPAPGIEPRRQARVVKNHQREQPARLGLLRGQRELAGEPDRLAGQVDPGGRARMPGRVDEVEHAQHDGEVAGLVQAAPTHGALGAADPLRHRRLGDVEGVGDLLGGEAADGTQGQRHLRRGREVGVTATEEQEERVVALLRGGRSRLRELGLLAALPGGLAAAGVDEPPRRDLVATRARSRGGCSGHTRSASSSASCNASSAPSKSSPGGQGSRAPRYEVPPEPAQRALVPAVVSARRSRWVSRPRRLGHHLADVEPLVQRLAARAGLGGDVRRDLEGAALVGLDVDHEPARDQVAGLGVRAVGGDWRRVRAAVAHPGARRRERLRVDVLAVLLKQLLDVPLEGHVRLHVLGRPPVHRREGMVRLRAAAVMLEKQVLGHVGLLVWWATPVEALHRVSGAVRHFSTWNHSWTVRRRRWPDAPLRRMRPWAPSARERLGGRRPQHERDLGQRAVRREPRVAVAAAAQALAVGVARGLGQRGSHQLALASVRSAANAGRHMTPITTVTASRRQITEPVSAVDRAWAKSPGEPLRPPAPAKTFTRTAMPIAPPSW